MPRLPASMVLCLKERSHLPTAPSRPDPFAPRVPLRRDIIIADEGIEVAVQHANTSPISISFDASFISRYGWRGVCPNLAAKLMSRLVSSSLRVSAGVSRFPIRQAANGRTFMATRGSCAGCVHFWIVRPMAARKVRDAHRGFPLCLRSGRPAPPAKVSMRTFRV